MGSPPPDAGDSSPRGRLAAEMAAEVMQQLRHTPMPAFHHNNAKRPAAGSIEGRPKKARPAERSPTGLAGTPALALPRSRPGPTMPPKPVGHAADVQPRPAPAAQHLPPPPPLLPQLALLAQQQQENAKLLYQVTRVAMATALHHAAAGQEPRDSSAAALPAQLQHSAAMAAAPAPVATPMQGASSQPAPPVGAWQPQALPVGSWQHSASLVDAWQPPASPVGSWQQPASAAGSWQHPPASAAGSWQQQPASTPLRPAMAHPGSQATLTASGAPQGGLSFKQLLARQVGRTMLEAAAQNAAAELERLLAPPPPSPGTLQLAAAAAAAPPSTLPVALAAFESLRIPLPPLPSPHQPNGPHRIGTAARGGKAARGHL